MKVTILILLTVLLQSLLFSQSNHNRIKINEDIELVKLSDNAYVHISLADIGSYGKVSSNGLLLVQEGEAFLFDTPFLESQTQILYNFVLDSLKSKIVKFAPNHWHEDCVGGLSYLHNKGVKSYAGNNTIDILKEEKLTLPNVGFKDSLSINLKEIDVKLYFFGAGHSLDNIVVWIPSEKILFPGCMVKDMTSKGLGNTSDADVNQWPKTINTLIDKFPDAKIVIPGHGDFGGIELLNHTYSLFEN